MYYEDKYVMKMFSIKIVPTCEERFPLYVAQRLEMALLRTSAAKNVLFVLDRGPYCPYWLLYV